MSENKLSQNKEQVLALLKEGVGTPTVAQMFGVSRMGVVNFRDRHVLRAARIAVMEDYNAGMDPEDICTKYKVGYKKGNTFGNFLEWHNKQVHRAWRNEPLPEKGLANNYDAVMADIKAGMPNCELARKYRVYPSRLVAWRKTHCAPKYLPQTSKDPFQR